MDPVTHLAAGVLISQVLPGPSRGWSALAGAAFALWPDLDYFVIFVDRLAFIRHHRGFTHSLAALFLFALLGAALGRALGGPRWFRPLLFLGLAVLASHLLLDLATSYGTQILFPFSRQRFTLDWLFIIDPYLTALLLCGAVAALASATWGRTAGTCLLAAAGAYVLLCGFYHQQALTLARQVFRQPAASAPAGSPPRPHTLTLPGQALAPEPEPLTVAALPQPFSCRRWQLDRRQPRRSAAELCTIAVPGLAGIPAGRTAGDPPAGACRLPGAERRLPAPAGDAGPGLDRSAGA